jgi:NADH:ubiquinone oxidoreductase subunit
MGSDAIRESWGGVLLWTTNGSNNSGRRPWVHHRVLVFVLAQHRVQVVVDDMQRDGVPDHVDTTRDKGPMELEEPEVDHPAATESYNGWNVLK